VVLLRNTTTIREESAALLFVSSIFLWHCVVVTPSLVSTSNMFRPPCRLHSVDAQQKSMAWYLNLPASLFASWHKNVLIHVVQRALTSSLLPRSPPGSGIHVVNHLPRISASWSVRYLHLNLFRLFFSFLCFHTRYPICSGLSLACLFRWSPS
jgi:hypothetical protein